MPAEILRRPEVSRRTGLGRSALYAEILASRFPKQVKLGPGAVGWLAEEVDKWIADRVAARDRDAAEADEVAGVCTPGDADISAGATRFDR